MERRPLAAAGADQPNRGTRPAAPRCRRAGTLALIAAAALATLTLATFRVALGGELVNEQVRAALLKQQDGRITRIETPYSDIFIIKRGSLMSMSSRLKGRNYTESITNLADPNDLPVPYTWMMTVGVIYPDEPKHILMIGLGGGTVTTYLGRFLPDLAIDTVEIDPGVIAAAKKYFGIRETARVRYVPDDGRVFLNRNKKTYDVILIDAFRGGNVPFHLATREFYTLVKERLTPTGAVVLNVNESTRFYASTLVTLSVVFPSVHLFQSGEGVIAVATASTAPDDATLARRAADLQQRYGFRFALPGLLAQRVEQVPAGKGQLLTDDFAPVDVDDAIGPAGRK